MRPVMTAARSSTAAKSVNLSISPITAMKNTGQATSSRPLRASERSLPPRVAMKSNTINAPLAAPAIIAINSQSRPPCIVVVLLFFADLQDGEECFLRNLHVAHLLHALLPGLLLLQQLPLAG